MSELVQLFPYEVTEHKVEQIIHWAHLGDHIEEKVSNLSEKSYAQLLLSIARSSKRYYHLKSRFITFR